MKRSSLLGLILGSTTLFPGCSNDGATSCAGVPKKGAAVEIRSDGACVYEGTARRVADIDRDGELSELDEPETFEFSCQPDHDKCVCRAGEGFGRYELELFDTTTNGTDVAILDIVPEAPPVCVQTDVVQFFEAMGGAGGQGGGGGAH